MVFESGLPSSIHFFTNSIRAFSGLVEPGDMQGRDTHEEIEREMDELARRYHEIHDPEIPEEIYSLSPTAHGI
jgi:hypothetical protein